MRILHVAASLSLSHGGTTSAIIGMLTALESLGVECDVATSDDDGHRKRLAVNAPERAMQGRYLFAKRCGIYTYTPGMARWLEAHVAEYDLVHIHGLFSHVNGLAGRACRKYSVPYIVTPHGMATKYSMSHKPLRKTISYTFVERTLLTHASAIHMTSQSEEKDFADLKIDTPITRIPLAVQPVAQGNAATFRALHPEANDRHVAVFLGRIDPVKNLEAIIDALALPAVANVHLFVGGDFSSSYAARLSNRATKLGVADRVSWLGFVTGQDKANLLAGGDMYLQPSLLESFGLAAVEAISAGLPCVLGENVAIAEDLVAAGFAVSVPPTAEGVADGIIKVMNLTSSCAGFRCKAREYVSLTFSKDRLGQALADTYAQVIAQ